MRPYQVLIFFVIFLNCLTASAQPRNKVIGHINPGNLTDTVYLVKGKKGYLQLSDLIILDSAIIRNGKFELNYQFLYTDFYSIRFRKLGKSFAFIGDVGTSIRIQIDTSNFEYPGISGSKENDLRIAYGKILFPMIYRMNSYVDSAYNHSCDSVQKNEYDKLNDEWAMKIRATNLEFIRKKSTSFQALSMLAFYYFAFSDDSVRMMIRNLPPTIRTNPMADDILFNKFTRPLILKNIHSFYDFTLFDTLRKNYDLNSLKGKLILLDFWGSWCNPCIKNFPKLKELYEKYRSKGVEIVGISNDVDYKTWKNSVAKWELPWISLADLKGSQGVSGIYYNIEYLPTYILIGKDGQVIQSHISEDEIDKLIEANL